MLSTARCGSSRPSGAGNPAEALVVRVGVSVGQVAASNPAGGLRQIAQIFSIESLARFGEDGRPQPWLAESWKLSADFRELDVRIRRGVTFSDGSSLDSTLVKQTLERMLPQSLGPAFGDFEAVTVGSPTDLKVRFRRASPFLLDLLEAQIQKPGSPSIGTGPLKLAGAAAPNQLVRNDDYYLGAPTVARMTISSYPSVRAAWADMLRQRLDILWEVGVDALDSLKGSDAVRVYPFTRRYQYEIAFGPANSRLAPASVRRAISDAVDREDVVREALGGYGVPSTGVFWPQHWALESTPQPALFQPARVPKEPLGIAFKCLVAPDYERIALVVKRQLAAIGVEMQLEESSPDEIFKAVSTGRFDAALIDVISGPSPFRVYEWWHTGGSLNPGSLGNSRYDAGLDAIRHAATDSEYRSAVADLQRLFSSDPPAVFIAWSTRARAVSTRFSVPDMKPGRDPIATLRLWRPAANGSAVASRN